MENRVLNKRFGAIAIEKGFITKEQFVEGMAMPIEDDIEGTEHTLIGSLLSNMGYMTSQQVHEVLEVLLAR